MNIAILGTGIVAKTVTPRLLAAGHSVVLGSRNPRGEWTLRLNFAVIREPSAIHAKAK